MPPRVAVARVAVARPRARVAARRPRVPRARASSRASPRAALTVTFIDADGASSSTTVVAPAVLRDVARGADRELYAGLHRLFNCGGVGNCGTCVVDVLDGAEHLSARTPAEARKIDAEKTPRRRLACQCVVDGADGADLVVALRPKP